MRVRRLRLVTTAIVAFLMVVGGSSAPLTGLTAAEIPDRLTDEEFWKLSTESSEADGYFQSDNLLSNELVFARLVPDLAQRARLGGVYLGVGPEQNFTYIAAIKPRIAVITDIRRGNLHLHLMYKALFELSANRSEFVARLFTKPRAASLTSASSVVELMNAYWDAFTGNEATFAANLKAIHDHLTVTRRLPLPQADLDGIARVYRAFYWYGPAITYSSSTSLSQPPGRMGTTYWDLMVQADASGTGLSYLGSEDRFRTLKDLQSRNLVVPVVGNFGGPTALRAVGTYIRSHKATVTAFYLSNVESYLRRDGSWGAFCSNVATMPLDEQSLYIRPAGMGRGGISTIVLSAPASAAAAGRPPLPFITFGPASISAPTGSPQTLVGGLVPIQAEVRANCGG